MSDTDFSWLAAKQKRLKTWRSFAANEIQSPQIKQKTEELLGLFGETLNQMWESKSQTAEDLNKLESLERDLEQLNEEARLRVVAKA